MSWRLKTSFLDKSSPFPMATQRDPFGTAGSKLERSHWSRCHCSRCEWESTQFGLLQPAVLAKVSDRDGRVLRALIAATASDAEVAESAFGAFQAAGATFAPEAIDRRVRNAVVEFSSLQRSAMGPRETLVASLLSRRHNAPFAKFRQWCTRSPCFFLTFGQQLRVWQKRLSVGILPQSLPKRCP